MADVKISEKMISDDDAQFEHLSLRDQKSESTENGAEQIRARLNAKIANPLAGLSHHELAEKGEAYARLYEIGGADDIRAFRLGAILAQDPNRHAEVGDLNPDESEVLEKEITNKWSQPSLLYLVIVLCSTCAAVQGMGMLYLHF
jgi:hypothetical protein